MKRIIAAALVLSFLVGVVPSVSAHYEKALVVQKMRANALLLGQINAAVIAKDFYAAATHLAELAQNLKATSSSHPPKGSIQDWRRVHAELILAAFRGIGACGERDLAKLKSELATIMALQKEGHTKFR